MGRKGSRKRRHSMGNARGGGTVVALKTPPTRLETEAYRQPQKPSLALPLAHRDEPLVTQAAPAADTMAPLPRNLSLVDPRMPMMRRVRLWFFAAAERWVERRKPLPEQPTLAQLDKLRKELASVQRKLDRMIG
jgi:hypothetical protein